MFQFSKNITFLKNNILIYNKISIFYFYKNYKKIIPKISKTGTSSIYLKIQMTHNVIDRIESSIFKYLELIKPKSYDRITWVVVTAGVGLLTKPWWLGIFNDVLEIGIDMSLRNKEKNPFRKIF